MRVKSSRVPPEATLTETTLTILAGGESTRMGTSKATLDVNGIPVLEHLLDRLKWPGPTLLALTQGQQLPGGADRFDQRVRDQVAGQGPLQGVLAALDAATTPVIVIMAIDMLVLRREDLAWYVSRLHASPTTMGIMVRRNQGIEPLPCALRIESRQLVCSAIASGRRSLAGLSDDPRMMTIEAGNLPPRIWANANTPDDWQQLTNTLED